MTQLTKEALVNELLRRGFARREGVLFSPNDTVFFSDAYLDQSIGEFLDEMVTRREKVFRSVPAVGRDAAIKSYDDVLIAIAAGRMRLMAKSRFEAELVEGHKGVTVVLVPFNPEKEWSRKPVRLAGRRHGWLVHGKIDGIAFDGYIGERWGRYFIIVDRELRQAADISVGEAVVVVVEPTSDQRVFERALLQSKHTTQPKKARVDAVVV